jgi:hypothetical protein
MNSDADIVAQQKALLAARAELDRTRLAFAMQGILAMVAPEADATVAEPRWPGLATLVSVLARVFGANKVSRWVRYASLGMTAARLIRNWRTTR